jgi:hypothetical protein
MHHDQIVALRRRSGMSVLIEQAANQTTPPTHCASIRRDLMSPRISRPVGDIRVALLPSWSLQQTRLLAFSISSICLAFDRDSNC